MSKRDFDPFGEPVPASETPVTNGSEWLKLVGNGIFWLLVAGIVLARAFYFQPAVFTLEPVAVWTQTVLAAL